VSGRAVLAAVVPVVVLSVALNIAQARRLVELERAIEGPGVAQAGQIAPDLRVRGLDGSWVTLRLGSRSAKPHVLYVFRPSCGWCRQDVDAVNSLVAQISGRYDVVGLSLSSAGLGEFAAR
jgi:hypothetical protein